MSPTSLLLASALSLGAAHDAPEPSGLEFNRDVRPILSRHCFPCHGPDEAARQAELRLDQASAHSDPRGILEPAGLLLERIEASEPDDRMPPPEAKLELEPADLEILRRWIEAGAPYQDHWSFRPVESPALPTAPDADWARQPFDHFVLARLQEQGLSPSPEADRRTLIRRLSFDLCGLPPTPEQVRAFVEDERPDAYERLVDQLLESDAHAERMTLAWMDAARYGDTSVYHADGPRDMWPWRDWVIEAYASNMPFDQFTLEQLAGDLLPDAPLGARVAAGFHRNNGTSDEGGAIDEELRVSYMVDRVKTTSNVWLGLSMECAQCHDHKYDPVTQDDYYRFYAYFNQSVEDGFQTRNGNEAPLVRVPRPMDLEREATAESALAEAEAALAALELPRAEQEAWVQAERASLLEAGVVELSSWSLAGPYTAPNSGTAFRTAWGPELAEPEEPVEWRLDESLQFDPPRATPQGGNSALYLRRTLSVDRPMRKAVSLGSDDTIQVWLNGEELLSKETYRGVQRDQERVELDLVEGENVFLAKVCNGGGPAGFYFRIVDSALPEPVQAALLAEADARNDEQRSLLEAHYREQVWEAGVAAKQRVDESRGALQAARNGVPTVMTMQDRPGGRMTYVLDRGQYDSPTGEALEPRALDWLLPTDPEAPKNRLGLAQWLVDPRHPLTARVAVNRHWALLFGRGLVPTVMDFGSQGGWPSHPRLLDWLAADFVEHGWDVRRLLRQIVTSATYRQSSVVQAGLRERDPDNELLARAPRYRLQGEFLRDQALAVSGLLVDEVGGPGVKPYQPPGLWNEVSLNGNLRFQQDSGEKLYRRSMYIYWKRSAPMPAMTTFDAPTREKCVVQRQRTNTPLQALVTLNDVQFVEAARHLAERMLAAGASFEERLDAGFELCTARPADEGRRAVMARLIESELAHYRAAPEEAAALLAVGESARDEALDPAEHAAWTVLASALLNLDETLNRD